MFTAVYLSFGALAILAFWFVRLQWRGEPLGCFESL